MRLGRRKEHLAPAQRRSSEVEEGEKARKEGVALEAVGVARGVLEDGLEGGGSGPAHGGDRPGLAELGGVENFRVDGGVVIDDDDVAREPLGGAVEDGEENGGDGGGVAAGGLEVGVEGVEAVAEALDQAVVHLGGEGAVVEGVDLDVLAGVGPGGELDDVVEGGLGRGVGNPLREGVGLGLGLRHLGTPRVQQRSDRGGEGDLATPRLAKRDDAVLQRRDRRAHVDVDEPLDRPVVRVRELDARTHGSFHTRVAEHQRN
mmetsp:Transcript_2564/g.7976  ORF Transcript_2564/g.7976 Transcript_2564/m.7976 type:complete len:260 (-) Transcript_2564:304-1083(-)